MKKEVPFENLRGKVLTKIEGLHKNNDEVIFPDKVRLNLYYYYHQSLATDLRMIVSTVLGLHPYYAGERL